MANIMKARLRMCEQIRYLKGRDTLETVAKRLRRKEQRAASTQKLSDVNVFPPTCTFK